jgi:uncharacterized protein
MRSVLVVLLLAALPVLAGDLADAIRLEERGDFARAAKAYERAAAKGEGEAARRLGMLHYHGTGVAKDSLKAASLLKGAAEAGDAEAPMLLAKMYQYGMGLAPDEAEAARWFRKAAEAGDPVAQFELSVAYYQGNGVPKDRTEAAKWWTLALRSGGRYAEAIRPSVDSAEAKLTEAEREEGRSRAERWASMRPAR